MKILILTTFAVASVGLLMAAILNKMSSKKPKKKKEAPTDDSKKKEEKQESTDWFWKKHPIWTTVTVILALTFCDTLVYAVKYVGLGMVSGVDAAARGTPRSAWGIGSPEVTVQIIPPVDRKNPITWGAGVKARLRPRLHTEHVKNGVAFVEGVPPQSWIELSLGCNQRPEGGAYLVSLTEPSFPSEEALEARIRTKDYTKGFIFDLPGLSSSMEHSLAYENTTGASPEVGSKVNEMYIQIPQGGPNTIVINQIQPPGTFQYEVEVGVDDISFALPETSWKYAWVVPVYHEDYEAIFRGQSVRPNGASVPSRSKMFSIQLTANGEKTTLERAKFFQPDELQNSTMSLALKLPGDNPTPEQLERTKNDLEKPARVIVGIQLDQTN